LALNDVQFKDMIAKYTAIVIFNYLEDMNDHSPLYKAATKSLLAIKYNVATKANLMQLAFAISFVSL